MQAAPVDVPPHQRHAQWEEECRREVSPDVAPPSLERLWADYEANPNFFDDIEIARDGGLSESDDLTGLSRYLFALLAVFFVFLNTWSILTVNASYIWPGEESTFHQVFLVSQYYLVELFENLPGGIDLLLEDSLIFIGVIEVLIVFLCVLRICYHMWHIVFISDEMMRWTAAQEMFFNAIPEAGTISALKLLNFVAPAVIVPALTNIFTLSSDSLCIEQFCHLIWFLATRGVCAIIGFDAFLFKLQTISIDMQRVLETPAEELDLRAVLGLAATSCSFLNQMLGIVQLGWFIRRRLFIFIFAGEGGFLSEEELALKEMWETLLVQRIWIDRHSWHEAIATYLSWSDFDFQTLALETVKPGRRRKRPRSENRKKRMAEIEAVMAAAAAASAVRSQEREVQLTCSEGSASRDPPSVPTSFTVSSTC